MPQKLTWYQESKLKLIDIYVNNVYSSFDDSASYQWNQFKASDAWESIEYLDCRISYTECYIAWGEDPRINLPMGNGDD